MKAVKGTLAYWKNVLHDVLAMVKQLGQPKSFLTLLLRWKELTLIISVLNRINMDENSEIDYFRKCEVLNSNPVLVARHFQYRVETFFNPIIPRGGLFLPGGKKKLNSSKTTYALNMEFFLL